jgi:hypothetical protein
METVSLGISGRTLVFHQVKLDFFASELQNIFAKKNIKTLAQTLQSPRYEHLSETVYLKYSDFLDTRVGYYLEMLKRSGDKFYKHFLNPYGDMAYCTFSIGSDLNYKGLYCYLVGEQIRYIGRCRDTFARRINYGYGCISPKNCFLDGQSTNCHLNALINLHCDEVELYVCRLVDNEEIEFLERQLIRHYQPEWNTALKVNSKLESGE